MLARQLPSHGSGRNSQETYQNGRRVSTRGGRLHSGQLGSIRQAIDAVPYLEASTRRCVGAKGGGGGELRLSAFGSREKTPHSNLGGGEGGSYDGEMEKGVIRMVTSKQGKPDGQRGIAQRRSRIGSRRCRETCERTGVEAYLLYMVAVDVAGMEPKV